MVEPSILKSVKKVIGLDVNDTSFDLDLILHINSVLSILNQIGVGPDGGLMIEDDSTTWDALIGSDSRLNDVKSYIYLRVRLLFDPPQTSFAIKAFEDQFKEFEFRMNFVREESFLPPVDSVVLDGGQP